MDLFKYYFLDFNYLHLLLVAVEAVNSESYFRLDIQDVLNWI